MGTDDAKSVSTTQKNSVFNEDTYDQDYEETIDLDEDESTTHAPYLTDDKDILVFLNFTWKGKTYQIEDVFANDEFSGNITDTLMKILNHGVGYVIVPDGELPEADPDNTVEIIQTVQL